MLMSYQTVLNQLLCLLRYFLRYIHAYIRHYQALFEIVYVVHIDSLSGKRAADESRDIVSSAPPFPCA